MAISPIIEKLLHVKNEQVKLEKELEDARTKLGNCSYIENLPQWSILFENVTKIAVQLSDVSRELAQLEHCHVHINQGQLPY